MDNDKTPAPGTTPHACVLTLLSRPASPVLPHSPTYYLSPSPDRLSPGPNLGSVGGNPGSPDAVFEPSGAFDNDMQFQFEEPVDEPGLLRTPETTLPGKSPPRVGPVVRLRPDWHPPTIFEPPLCRRKLDGDFVTETATEVARYTTSSEA